MNSIQHHTYIFKRVWCYNKALTQQHTLHTNGYISYAGSLLPSGTETSSEKAMQIIAFAVGSCNRTSQKWIRKTKLFSSAFTKLSACYLNFISGTADTQVTAACQKRIQDGGQRIFFLTDSLAEYALLILPISSLEENILRPRKE